MRIIQANSFSYRRGGDSLQYLQLVDALRARGHDVAQFSMHHPQSLSSEWAEYWVPHVEYRGSLTSMAKLRSARRSLRCREAGRQMRRLLRDFKPDVVHFHSVHHHLTMAAVDACLECGAPVVWTLHDYRTVCPATNLLKGRERCDCCAGGQFWHGVAGRCRSGELSRSVAAVVESYATRLRGALRKVDCFIAPSLFLAQKVASMGLPARRIEVVPNPVIAHGDVRAEERKGEEILYVGRLSVEKGVEMLVRAVARTEGVRLTVVGDGPDSDSLQALSRSSGADVRFQGWLDAEAVQGHMRRARLLCVPSIWYENCPGVVLEAMAAGLPVLASDLGGLTELLDGGRAGWLAPAGDPAAWSHVLRQALSQPERGRELAEAALARVRSRHDPEGFLDAIEAIYESLVDSRNATRVSASDR